MSNRTVQRIAAIVLLAIVVIIGFRAMGGSW